MKVGYLDCTSGISGDMTLGALVDAGTDLDLIRAALGPMELPGLDLKPEPVVSHGIAATRVHVGIDESPRHRTLSQVMEVVERADLSPEVVGHVTGAFRALAEAEGRVHGKPAEAIHFHEVGANDAIVDVVGACLGIEALGLERLACSRVVTGRGSFTCAHGTLPIPGPAAAALLEGFEVEGGDIEIELVTPTGAALLKEFCGSSSPMPPMRLLGSGYGAGSRKLPGRANVLRLLYGEIGDTLASVDGDGQERIAVIECDIDDMVPEHFSVLAEDLRTAGALDVTFMPVQMKKDRSGLRVTVLSPSGQETKLAKVLLAQSTTIGVRVTQASRYTLQRRPVTVETSWGPIQGKLVWGQGVAPRWTPEFDDARRIHRDRGVSMRDIYQAAVEAARSVVDEAGSVE